MSYAKYGRIIALIVLLAVVYVLGAFDLAAREFIQLPILAVW